MLRSDLILHPIRMRMIEAFNGRQLTASELSAILSDVPQATLYRHLKLLTQNEILQVVETRQAHSNTEKVYGLVAGKSHLGWDDLTHTSPEDHIRMYVVYLTTLMDDFQRYVAKTPPQEGDFFGYQKLVLNLNEEEKKEFATRLNEAILPFVNRDLTPDRDRMLVAFSIFPEADR